MNKSYKINKYSFALIHISVCFLISFLLFPFSSNDVDAIRTTLTSSTLFSLFLLPVSFALALVLKEYIKKEDRKFSLILLVISPLVFFISPLLLALL